MLCFSINILQELLLLCIKLINPLNNPTFGSWDILPLLLDMPLSNLQDM